MRSIRSARVSIEKDACVGCRVCELICSMFHEGEFNPSLARIHVFRDPFQGIYVPTVCIQCQNPKCLDACPESAIVIDELTRAKIIIEEKCTGCGKCAEACPINAGNAVVRYNIRKGVYTKCDLCGGSPKCVEWCPERALHYAGNQKG